MSEPRPPRGLAAVFAALTTPGADGKHPLLTAIGGVRGFVDSALPTTVFVIAIAVSNLRVAVLTAVVAAGLLVALRLVRREPLQQAVTGLFGVALSVLAALVLHRGSGFFLPGIIMQFAYAAAVLVSVAIRRPVIGYVAAIADSRLAPWRTHRLLRRAVTYATLIWGLVFAVRAAVMLPLYLQNRDGALGVAKLALGWPLWALAVGASVWLIRRAGADLLAEPALEPADPVQPDNQDAPSIRPS